MWGEGDEMKQRVQLLYSWKKKILFGEICRIFLKIKNEKNKDRFTFQYLMITDLYTLYNNKKQKSKSFTYHAMIGII